MILYFILLQIITTYFLLIWLFFVYLVFCLYWVIIALFLLYLLVVYLSVISSKTVHMRVRKLGILSLVFFNQTDLLWKRFSNMRVLLTHLVTRLILLWNWGLFRVRQPYRFILIVFTSSLILTLKIMRLISYVLKCQLVIQIKIILGKFWLNKVRFYRFRRTSLVVNEPSLSFCTELIFLSEFFLDQFIREEF